MSGGSARDGKVWRWEQDVGTMTGKGSAVPDMMERRNVNMCAGDQEGGE